MTLRFKPGDNVELNQNVFHSQSIDRILVRSGLLPLELGEGFKNDLTITSHAGISSRYDYTASITIDRLLPYPRQQSCDIYVDDSELNPAPATISANATVSINGKTITPAPGSSLSFQSGGQPVWSSPTRAYRFKPGEIVVLDPGADIDGICRRSGTVGLNKDDITEIKINRIAAHTMLGVPTGVDYEATIKISTNHWLFHVYLMENEINYTVSCSDHKVLFEGPKAPKVCTHPKKYLNVISAGLKFWCCPDCKKEIE
jgi:hypothetical protein